jgi:hypothetical protein
MDKKDKLLKIIQELQDIYPHLDRLMITDLDNPDSIIITSEKNLEEIAAVHGVDVAEVEEYFADDLDGEQLSLLEWNDDDDDKGPLQ